MSKENLTSWERRTRRRIIITVTAIVLIIIGAAAYIFYRLMTPYETWDMSQFYTIQYGGYNGKGTAEIIPDNDLFDKKINQLKSDYDTSLIHRETVNAKDYIQFRDSITVTLSEYDNLSNNTTLIASVKYDQILANKLRVKLNNLVNPVQVTGLPDVTLLTVDDLFKNVSVSFDGVSPNVTVNIENASNEPFLQTIIYTINDSKDYYTNGETVTLRAAFSEDEALKMHYAVDTPNENCLKDYVVNSGQNYLSDSAHLTESSIDEAVNAGYNAFTNANEYGVRIFCEAGLVPVYVNKQATFEWVSPSLRSVYFKSVLPNHAGEKGTHYNELDVIYNVKITQANGVTCPCYAVVRFSDIVICDDNTIVFDFSDPKIVSSDYKISNIEKTVITMYDETHIVTKVK